MSQPRVGLRILGGIFVAFTLSAPISAASPVEVSGTVEAQLGWSPTELLGATTTFENIQVAIQAGPNLALVLRAPWEGDFVDAIDEPYVQPTVLSNDLTLYTVRVRGPLYPGGTDLRVDAGHVDLLWGQDTVYRYYRRGVRLHGVAVGSLQSEGFLGWDNDTMKPELGWYLDGPLFGDRVEVTAVGYASYDFGTQTEYGEPESSEVLFSLNGGSDLGPIDITWTAGSLHVKTAPDDESSPVMGARVIGEIDSSRWTPDLPLRLQVDYRAIDDGFVPKWRSTNTDPESSAYNPIEELRGDHGANLQLEVDVWGVTLLSGYGQFRNSLHDEHRDAIRIGSRASFHGAEVSILVENELVHEDEDGMLGAETREQQVMRFEAERALDGKFFDRPFAIEAQYRLEQYFRRYGDDTLEDAVELLLITDVMRLPDVELGLRFDRVAWLDADRAPEAKVTYTGAYEAVNGIVLEAAYTPAEPSETSVTATVTYEF